MKMNRVHCLQLWQLSGNLYNFHVLSLNNYANPSTNVVSFPTTNSNFVIKSTVKYVHGLSSILFAINFSTSIFILFFILWFKSYLSIYFSKSFVTLSHQ